MKAAHGEENYALLLRDDYAYSTLWTVTVPDAYPDFYRMPAPVLSRIRQAVPVNGIWLEGLSRVSLFVYDNDSVILYPYVMDGVQQTKVRLHINGGRKLTAKGEGCSDGQEAQPLHVKNGEAVFELPAVPGEYRLYKILREK